MKLEVTKYLEKTYFLDEYSKNLFVIRSYLDKVDNSIVSLLSEIEAVFSIKHEDAISYLKEFIVNYRKDNYTITKNIDWVEESKMFNAFEKWNAMGFLLGLDEEIKELTSKSYEEACNFITSDEILPLNAQFEETYMRIETIVFPIIRRIISKIYDEECLVKRKYRLTDALIEKRHVEIKKMILDSFDVKYVINKIYSLGSSVIDSYDKLYCDMRSSIDLEAEITARISDMIQEAIILKFNNVVPIKLNGSKEVLIYILTDTFNKHDKMRNNFI